MPKTTIIVHGKQYRVACDAGDESALQDLAKGLDQQAREQVAGMTEPIDNEHVFLLLALALQASRSASEEANQRAAKAMDQATHRIKALSEHVRQALDET